MSNWLADGGLDADLDVVEIDEDRDAVYCVSSLCVEDVHACFHLPRPRSRAGHSGALPN